MKKKKPIPEKYAKAVAESKEYMKLKKEVNKELKLVLKANRFPPSGIAKKMNTENLFLVFNRNEWELYRLAKLGFEFTDEEIEAGLKNERGYLGTRNHVDCYISKHLIANPH